MTDYYDRKKKEPARDGGEKALIRSAMVREICGLPEQSRRAMDRRIAERILQLPAWSSAQLVLGYLAMADEATLDTVIQTALTQRKQVALPRLDPAGGEMRFLLVSGGLGELETHRFGFRQPPATAEPADPGGPAIVLVPGRAFDRSGYRIGHGGGYYDRFLAHLDERLFSVGVGYAFQCCEQLPRDSWDVAVRAVVTDRETIHCAAVD